MAEHSRPQILVVAGTNGAGKSSIAGAVLTRCFNPDEAARRLLEQDPNLEQHEANSIAWHWNKHLLERAIDNHDTYRFETTLGGKTITALLERALDSGFDVRVWYAGLSSPELHIARVRSRVARGGHGIPERAIRRRYDDSRKNLIRLLPRLQELRVYDNSQDADPANGSAPSPTLVLHLVRGAIIGPGDLSGTPDWAKPIVAAALKL